MVRARYSAEDRAVLLRRHLDEGIPLAALSSEAGIPVRTLHRWMSQYRADQTIASLERRQRSDQGIRSLPADLAGAIEGLALRRPPPTLAFIHRRISAVAEDRGLRPPSYSTVRAIVRGIDPGMRTMAHEGDSAYRDRFEVVFRRTASRPNEQWQCDHTELDIAVIDSSGKQVRPWLTVVLDDYSRAAAGYTVFLGAPTSFQTGLALHQAMRRKTVPGWPVMGLPDVLYSDHGSDFTSVHLERVCLDTHVRLIHSRPGVPQGRGKIERFYRTVTEGLLPHLPGFIPHGRNGEPITAPALSLEQLDHALEQFIVKEYNRQKHSETQQAPIERWAAGGWVPRMPASDEDLDLLLLTVATERKVHRDGVHFQGIRYLSLTLSAYVGEAVTLRYNPRDMAEIRVYLQDAFLCSAIAPELSSGAISLKQLQAARSLRRKDLKKQLKGKLSLADALPFDDRYAQPVPPEPSGPEAPATGPGTRLRIYAED